MKVAIVILSVLVVSIAGVRVEGQEGQEGELTAKFKHHVLSQLLPVSPNVGVGRYGGVDCVACTLMTYMVEALAILHNNTVDKELEAVCNLFPSVVADTCDYLVATYGPAIIKGFANFETADEICHDLEVCTNTTCHLFPKTEDRESKYVYAKNVLTPPDMEGFIMRRELMAKKKGFTSWEDMQEKFDPWKWLEAIFSSLIHHEPLIDLDDDLFSTIDTLRGAYWRGKDCNDFSDEIYPGRKTSEFTASTDYNCNGISGKTSTGESYEKKFCDGTDRMGTIVIGDSAAAHFHIPVPYFVPRDINSTTFDHLLDPFVEDEFDWPHRSWSTGHLKDTTGDCPGPLDSIYLRMNERNLCNHRDYQTLAVNGANSGSVMGGITQSIARNNKTDQPVLLFYALIGNDVCHPEHSLDRMTTVPEFEVNVLKSLEYLDGVLPSGSHVVFEGLANGSFLYSHLAHRHYPLSDELTYADIYNFLNCVEVAPCWVWMNSEKKIRDLGSQRAANLSKVYDKIIKNYKFKNFDMAYTPFPILEVVKIWVAEGGQPWQLIEPLDGFHPNQWFQALEARVIWEWLEKEHPDFLPAVNPNNAAIKQMFGNQGGY